MKSPARPFSGLREGRSQTSQTQGGGELPPLRLPVGAPEGAGGLLCSGPWREGLGTGFEGEEMGKGINGATLVWLCAWAPV